MERKIILHLCASEYGSDTKPYRDAGYDVRLVTKDVGIENYHPPKNVYGIIANPPCTMFSRARTTAKTPRDFREGMRLVKECLRVIWECESEKHLAFWALENPGTGFLRNFLGKPAFEYHPYEFGDNFSKKTALWGNFKEPKHTSDYKKSPHVLGKSINGESWWKELKKRVEPWGDIKAKGHERETDMKSIAPPGFTKAFFESNK